MNERIEYSSDIESDKKIGKIQVEGATLLGLNKIILWEILLSHSTPRKMHWRFAEWIKLEVGLVNQWLAHFKKR